MPDKELERVVAEFRSLDPEGVRTQFVLRKTLDQLYDGQHTGRYRWDQLYKTEKTHCGTLVEINLHREFKFGNGQVMDYCIAGVEVDCKYSQSIGGWMIPPESMGHLCMVVSADDRRSTWCLGFVRIAEKLLSGGGNRDGKRSITASGRGSILWIFERAALPPNILLQLPESDVQRVFSLNSGQRRIDEIFRTAKGKRIGRGVIATLGQQEDYMKRVRGNGGSRTKLQREGIIILGDYVEHRRIAQQLEIEVPAEGEFVSIRLSPASSNDSPTVSLNGRRWRMARDTDPVTPAPDCPHS